MGGGGLLGHWRLARFLNLRGPRERKKKCLDFTGFGRFLEVGSPREQSAWTLQAGPIYSPEDYEEMAIGRCRQARFITERIGKWCLDIASLLVF